MSSSVRVLISEASPKAPSSKVSLVVSLAPTKRYEPVHASMIALVV